jgi:hypothetical protein
MHGTQGAFEGSAFHPVTDFILRTDMGASFVPVYRDLLVFGYAEYTYETSHKESRRAKGKPIESCPKRE